LYLYPDCQKTRDYATAIKLISLDMRILLLLLLASIYPDPVFSRPYFKPWLTNRQIATPGASPPLLYPKGQGQSTCPSTQANLWGTTGVLLQSRSLKPRHATSRPLERKGIFSRQTNGTTPPSKYACSQIASFSFSDWEQSAANTPSIMLPPNYQYTFSISANVPMASIQAWGAKTNSNSYTGLGKSSPKSKQASVTFNLKDQLMVHFEVSFQYGHPNGNVALFTNEGPPTRKQ